MAQPAPRIELKKLPANPVAAHRPSSKKMISPAYMFPYKRSERESGLDRYSTRLNRKLNGQSRGLAPNGEQNNSWIQPPSPFTLILKKIIRSRTEIDSAKVVFTSAVGTCRHACA